MRSAPESKLLMLLFIFFLPCSEKLEHQFAGAEARVKSLTSQQLQVEDEIRTLKLSTASASAVRPLSLFTTPPPNANQ